MFVIEGAKKITFGIPLPGGLPAHATNLRFEKAGYVPVELHWWKEHEDLGGKPIIVKLSPVQPN